MAVFAAEYDFYLLTPPVLRRRLDLLRRILAAVDFVHAMDPSSASLLLDGTVRSDAPLLTSIHHVTSWSPRHEAVARESQLLLAPTERWRDAIRRSAPHVPVAVVRYGVDSDFFCRVPADRPRFGIPPEAFAVGFIASRGSDRDDGRKGLDTLQRVLRGAHRAIGNLHVCFSGPGWEKMVQSLNRNGVSASWAGFLPQRRLPQLYSSLDAYLSTSRVEGGPCTVLEAMACEVPVVATRVGLVPDVIQHSLNGYSAEPDDAPGLAATLAAIAADPAGARQLGRRARRTVLGMSWHETLQALRGPYATMCEIGRRRQGGPRGDFPLAARLLRASTAADVLLYSAATVRAGEVSLPDGVRMLAALCGGMRAGDIVSGLGLISGLTFRAA